MYLKRTSYFIRNFQRQKLKLPKAKLNFYNTYAEVNADVDAEIFKWSREATVSYLVTKI